MKELIFKDWQSIGNVAFCTVIGYFVLFLFIRISGKRTLAKLTAFDFVVTITLGSTLSSMILGKVTLIEGAVSLAIIILLQYLLAFSAKRSHFLEKAINASPTLVYYRGNYLKHAMEKEVLTKEEVLAAVREAGLGDVEDVEAVVMEINGELAVVKKSFAESYSSLEDIEIPNKKGK